MKHFKVGYSEKVGQDLTYLPDVIKADTPQKAIEYARYYLEMSEGKTQEETSKLIFLPMMQESQLETWLKKAIQRIIFLCGKRNTEMLFFANDEDMSHKSLINDMSVILGEYQVLLKRMGYKLELEVDFNTTLYEAFTITDYKTGEIVFVCDKL